MGLGFSELAILLAFPMVMFPGLPLGVPPQAPDPLLANVAQEDCRFYFVSHGNGETVVDSGNRAEQLFADPEVQRAFSKVREALSAAMAESEAGEATRKVVEANLFMRPMCVCIDSFAINPDPAPGTPEMDLHGYALLKAGDVADDMVTHFVTLAKQNKVTLDTEVIAGETFYIYQEDDSPRIYFGSKRAYFLVGFGKGSIEDLFKNAPTDAPKWLTDAQTKVSIERPATMCHIDVEGILDDVGDAIPPAAKEYLTVSGISSTKTITFASGLGKEEFVSKFLVNTGGKYEGIYKLFDQEPLTKEQVAQVPIDAKYWAAMNVDLSKGEETLLKLVATTTGGTEAEAEAEINSQMEGAGLNLTDTLALLKGSLVFYQPPESGILGSDAVYSLSSPESKRLSDVVSSIVSSAAGAGGGFEGPNQPDDFFRGAPPQLINKSFRDNEYRIFRAGGFINPPLTPSWGVVDGKFVYSNTPQGLRTAIRAPKAEKPISDDPRVAAVLADEPIMMFSVDPRPLLPAMMMALQAFVLAGSTQDGFPEAFDASLLPPPRTVLKYVKPAVGSLHKHPDGLLFTMQESYPSLTSPGTAPVLVALLLPAVQAARAAAQRVASTNNIKQIGIAVHNYALVHDRLPADIVDEEGKPLLSWRVQLLPYLEQQALYDAMKLDEPWDSEHNIKFAEMILAVYQSPGYENTEGKTHYQAIKNGDGILITPTKDEDGKISKGITFGDVRDGLSNTAMVAEVVDAVPWSKPSDFVPDEKDVKKGLFGLRNGGTIIGLGDGSVHFVADSIDSKVLKAIFTRNGGEVTDGLYDDGLGDFDSFPKEAVPGDFPNEEIPIEDFPDDAGLEAPSEGEFEFAPPPGREFPR